MQQNKQIELKIPLILGHIFWESEKELNSMQYFSLHENAEQAQHCYLMAIKV